MNSNNYKHKQKQSTTASHNSARCQSATMNSATMPSKQCKDNLANIKLVANSIDLDKNSEIEITSAFNQINKASWTAIKSIERDAAERDA